MNLTSKPEIFFKNIQKECSIMSNVLFILNKMKNDSCFERLKQACSSIFIDEYAYVLGQIAKSSPETKGKGTKEKLVIVVHWLRKGMMIHNNA